MLKGTKRTYTVSETTPRLLARSSIWIPKQRHDYHELKIITLMNEQQQQMMPPTKFEYCLLIPCLSLLLLVRFSPLESWTDFILFQISLRMSLSITTRSSSSWVRRIVCFKEEKKPWSFVGISFNHPYQGPLILEVSYMFKKYGDSERFKIQLWEVAPLIELQLRATMHTWKIALQRLDSQLSPSRRLWSNPNHILDYTPSESDDQRLHNRNPQLLNHPSSLNQFWLSIAFIHWSCNPVEVDRKSDRTTTSFTYYSTVCSTVYFRTTRRWHRCKDRRHHFFVVYLYLGNARTNHVQCLNQLKTKTTGILAFLSTQAWLKIS